jgi:HEAT repeat protein
MSPIDPPGRGASPDLDEERRYRATRDMIPSEAGAIPRLLECLDDPSWRVRGAAAARLAEGDAAQVVPALVSALCAAAGPGRRAAAAGALVLIGSAAVPALVEMLEHGEPELRTAALEILGDVRDRSAVTAMSEKLRDPDLNTRIAAAAALGKTGGVRAVTALEDALAQPEAHLRRAILDALVQLRAPPSAARLTELASDKSLRRPALRLAALSTDPTSVALLVHALDDPSRTNRETALSGIGHRPLSGLDPLPDLPGAVRDEARRAPAIADTAVAALESDDPAVRAGALSVIGWIGEPQHAKVVALAAEDEQLRPLAAATLEALGRAAVGTLAGQLKQLPPVPRVVAAAALALHGNPAALANLLVALSSDEEAVRESALEALGRVGDPRAVPSLVTLLEHADRGVAGTAVAALVDLTGRRASARSSVLEACRARPAPMPPAYYRLLGRIGDAEDAAILRAGLKAADRGARVAAAAALAALGERTHVSPLAPPELLDALDDLDPVVRAAAAQALGTLGRAPVAWNDWGEVTRALAMALRDEEPAVRAAAALALGRCGADTYAPALAEVVHDTSAPPEVAVAAVHALSQLGAADARVLSSAARHPDPEVVKEAVRAASTLPGSAAADLLVAAAAHPRWDVRRAAASAIGARGDPALLDALRRLAVSEQDALVSQAIDAARRALEGRA